MSDEIGPLIVALDYASGEQALKMASHLDPSEVRLKVGKQLFTAEGPGLIRELHELGFQIFLDLKFHDIPSTVSLAVEAAANLGVWMLNVHALGGSRMLEAAREALQARAERPFLIAVTVLTSMKREDLAALNLGGEPRDRVAHLAHLAEMAGLDGVVCSALEAAMLKRARRSGFLLVTPGIRIKGDDIGDQRRVVAPKFALEAGATHIVVGRSITASDSPSERVAQIRSELADLSI